MRRYDPAAGGWLGERLAGREVVDLWGLADRVSMCCSRYRRRLHEYGVVDVAERCDSHLVCPHCATARAGLYASAVRRVVGSLTDPSGRLYRRLAGLPDLEDVTIDARLVTLTQRAVRGETLASALDRMAAALRRMYGHGASAAWRRALTGCMAGGRYQIEITRSWRGKSEGAPRPSWGQRWWHVHVHMVLVGEDLDSLRERWAERWQMQTERASAEVLGSGEGAAAASSRADGRWWVKIDLESLKEVFQATKYLAADIRGLDPAELVEMVTVARHRRWSGDWGTLRGVARQAEALVTAGQPDPCPPEVERPDWGPAVLAAEDCPVVYAHEAEGRTTTPLVCTLSEWVAADAPAREMVAALVDPGGDSRPSPGDVLAWSEWVSAAAEVCALQAVEWRAEVADRAFEALREVIDDRWPDVPDSQARTYAIVELAMADEQEAVRRQLAEVEHARAQALWSVDLADLRQGCPADSPASTRDLPVTFDIR